jgi:tetratricopeptide (TPR) repeat protein
MRLRAALKAPARADTLPFLPRFSAMVRPGRPATPKLALLAIALLGCALPFGPRTPEPGVAAHASPEAAAMEAFLRGRMLELDGDYAGAAEAYAEAARQDPASPDLARKLAQIYLRTGDTERAVEQAERALALAPDDEETRRTLAIVYVAAQQFDRAAALLEPGFEAGTLTPEGVFGLCRLWIQLGRFEDAERAAARLGELEPDDVRCLFAVGQGYAQAGRAADAERVYSDAQKLAPLEPQLFQARADLERQQGDPEGELAVLREKLAVLAGDRAALLRIAQIEHDRGDRDAAIRSLEELMQHEPGDAGAEFQLGYYLFEGKRYDEAAARFAAVSRHEGVRANPDYTSEVLYFLGLAQVEAKDHAAARETLAQIPTSSERYAEAQLLLARTYEREERWEDALAAAQRAQDREAKSVPVQVYVAGLLQRSGDLERAVGLMQELIASDPNNADLRYDLALLYGNAGQDERAVELMMEVVELDENHASALNYVGYTWADKGMRLDDAERMIERAVELRPKDGYITDSLGWLHYKRGMKLLEEGNADQARGAFETAVRELEHAVSLLEEGDPVITFHLGDAYRSVSRLGEALGAYRRALALDPTPRDAAEIRQRIELLELQTEESASGARR